MARGGFPGGGMKMGNAGMQQQLMRMQQQLMTKQAELEATELEAASGGGMVSAKVNGKKQLLALKINPQAVDPDDIEMLEDMVVAAVNEALRQIDELTEREMGKITGGMKLPGF